jgi:hypothetical protein
MFVPRWLLVYRGDCTLSELTRYTRGMGRRCSNEEEVRLFDNLCLLLLKLVVKRAVSDLL